MFGLSRAGPPEEGRSRHLAKKIRVYELARELGLTNKEALDLSLALGIGVKSHSSSIEDAQADRVRRKADAEGLRRPVQPEEPPVEKAPARGRPAASTDGGQPAATSADTASRPATPRPAAAAGGSGDEDRVAARPRSGVVTSRPASEVTALPTAPRLVPRPA